MNWQAVVLVLILSVTLSTQRNGSDGTQSLYKDGDVIVGGLFPLHLYVNKESGCSKLRPNVLIWSEAMVYAIEEINANQILLKNVALGYEIRDTCGSDQHGVAIAADFAYRNTLKFDTRFAVSNSCVAGSRDAIATRFTDQTPILAVVGGVDSSVSVNVASVLQLVDIPQISYGATSVELASSDFTSFFRTVPVDRFQSQAMVELVAHNGWTCVAVIGVDDWYGRSGVNSFVEAANKTGICIVSRDLFPVHDPEARIQQMIAKLKEMVHVQILILYSLAPQAIRVFKEAVRQDLTGKTWIASDGWTESSLIQQESFMPIIQGAIGFGFHRLKFPDFKKHVTRLTPQMRQGPWWNEFWEKVLGKETIAEELYEREFSDGIPAYVRDAVYAVAYGLQDWCDKGGSQCADSKSILPVNLLSSLKQLSFQGLTGNLDFQTGEAEAVYDIYNLQKSNQGSYKLVNVGFWKAARSQRLVFRDDLVQWNNGLEPRSSCGELCRPGTYRSTPNNCFWECVPCDEDTISERIGSTECVSCPMGFISNGDNTHCDEVPVEFITWHDPWGVGLTVLTAICIVLTLVVLGVIAYNHRTPIVRDTGPLLSMLLLITIALSHAFNLIHLSRPSALWCKLLPPSFYLIYTSAVVVQFMKIYRIRALLRPTAAHSFAHVSGIAVLVGLLPLVLSVVWVLVDPPHLQKYVVSRLIVYSVCKQYELTVGIVLRYLSAAHLSVLVIVTVVVAYKTKHLAHSHKFDEAKHLAFSMTLFLMTLATFYPGWSLIRGPILTVFACTTNIVAATGILFCVFGPKLWLLYRFPRLNTTRYVRPAPPETRFERATTLITIGKYVNSVMLGADDSPNHSIHSQM